MWVLCGFIVFIMCFFEEYDVRGFFLGFFYVFCVRSLLLFRFNMMEYINLEGVEEKMFYLK